MPFLSSETPVLTTSWWNRSLSQSCYIQYHQVLKLPFIEPQHFRQKFRWRKWCLLNIRKLDDRFVQWQRRKHSQLIASRDSFERPREIRRESGWIAIGFRHPIFDFPALICELRYKYFLSSMVKNSIFFPILLRVEFILRFAINIHLHSWSYYSIICENIPLKYIHKRFIKLFSKFEFFFVVHF